jgi:hypothetical protein
MIRAPVIVTVNPQRGKLPNFGMGFQKSFAVKVNQTVITTQGPPPLPV